ncbi:hypothetical protein ALO64_100714 [Pseudomonas meliae]|uniref:Uncharacterized protein n=2 Tax=Pseudomonas syringae group genomosp. 2 TaxID=251698 RepID=A0A0N8S2B0_9PSED|nr:hypothetical protein ALO64_100714 [Pseudomonas meliae]
MPDLLPDATRRSCCRYARGSGPVVPALPAQGHWPDHWPGPAHWRQTARRALHPEQRQWLAGRGSSAQCWHDRSLARLRGRRDPGGSCSQERTQSWSQRSWQRGKRLIIAVVPHERQRRQADGRYQCADLLRRPMPIPLSPHRYIQSPLLILAESHRSGLVRERAVTSAGDVSPEIKLSRTSSLPRPAGRSLNATIYHAQPSSLYTSPLLILAESRRSGLVREGAVTSAGGVSPEIKLSRTSSLPRPAGRSLNTPIFRARQDSCITMSAQPARPLDQRRNETHAQNALMG